MKHYTRTFLLGIDRGAAEKAKQYDSAEIRSQRRTIR
jgi:hypothetical protein